MADSSKTKVRAPKNRTLTLDENDHTRLRRYIMTTKPALRTETPLTGIAYGDYSEWVRVLPLAHVDFLFLDPPYNLDKSFNGNRFSRRKVIDYTAWLDEIIRTLKPLLKSTASIYICGDWRSSAPIHDVLQKYFTVRNRITWEREKGRGSKKNWKNNSEDIWYCTNSDKPVFKSKSVLLKRRVLAPYRMKNGLPKDWIETDKGAFRLTYPSNIWTDISVPFWSMSENTVHPTQKPE